MLDKKTKKGKCPFRNFKDCSEECVLYRRGVRFTELNDEATPIEICAVNVIADNIERLHNRTFMLQKEVGETKNVVAFKIMSDLGIGSEQEARKQAERVLVPIIEELEKKKLIEK